MSTVERKSEVSAAISALMNGIFSTDGFNANEFSSGTFGQRVPPVNIREGERKYILEAALPGFDRRDLEVHVMQGVLFIAGEAMEDDPEEENGTFTRREFGYGAFSRSFTLPEYADAGKIEACFANGVLKVIIPKSEAITTGRTRKIKIV